MVQARVLEVGGWERGHNSLLSKKQLVRGKKWQLIVVSHETQTPVSWVVNLDLVEPWQISYTILLFWRGRLPPQNTVFSYLYQIKKNNLQVLFLIKVKMKISNTKK